MRVFPKILIFQGIEENQNHHDDDERPDDPGRNEQDGLRPEKCTEKRDGEKDQHQLLVIFAHTDKGGGAGGRRDRPC